MNQSVLDTATAAWEGFLGCKEVITLCYETNADTACALAQALCNAVILTPLVGIYDFYYVPSENPDPYPADFSMYINNENITSKIGAEVEWMSLKDTVFNNFLMTGDWMRNKRAALETVIDAGVRTLIFDGDAVCTFSIDSVTNILCNVSTRTILQTSSVLKLWYISQLNTDRHKTDLSLFPGRCLTDSIYRRVQAAILCELHSAWTARRHLQERRDILVRPCLRSVSSHVFLPSNRINSAMYSRGHLVPAYKFGALEYGEAALQIFTQIMSGKSLSPT